MLPIAFGVMNDFTGVWTSCFMLLFALVGGALLWMHFAILRMEQRAVGEQLTALPELPELVSVHGPEHAGLLVPTATATRRRVRQPTAGRI